MTRSARPVLAPRRPVACPPAGHPPLWALSDAPSAVARPRHPGARVALSALALTLVTAATAGTAPRIDASVVAGGGGHSQSARFTLEGTTGQAAAAPLAGKRFTIDGGFWHSTPAERADSIFRNGFEN